MTAVLAPTSGPVATAVGPEGAAPRHSPVAARLAVVAVTASPRA